MNFTPVKKADNRYNVPPKKERCQRIEEYYKNFSTSSKMILEMIEKISKLPYIPMGDVYDKCDDFLWVTETKSLRVFVWTREYSPGRLVWLDRENKDYFVDDVDFLIDKLKEMYDPALPENKV